MCGGRRWRKAEKCCVKVAEVKRSGGEAKYGREGGGDGGMKGERGREMKKESEAERDEEGERRRRSLTATKGFGLK